MTTSASPLRLLKEQADKIAAVVKAADHGDKIEGSLKIGVVMDDKTMTIEFPWAAIRSTSEADIAAFVLKQMQGQL